MQTTPTCDEGLRWTVFKEPVSITPATMQKMYDWLASVSTTDGTKTNGYRANNRIPQPVNARTVWSYGSGGYSSPSTDGMADLEDGGYGGYGAPFSFACVVHLVCPAAALYAHRGAHRRNTALCRRLYAHLSMAGSELFHDDTMCT